MLNLPSGTLLSCYAVSICQFCFGFNVLCVLYPAFPSVNASTPWISSALTCWQWKAICNLSWGLFMEPRWMKCQFDCDSSKIQYVHYDSALPYTFMFILKFKKIREKITLCRHSLQMVMIYAGERWAWWSMQRKHEPFSEWLPSDRWPWTGKAGMSNAKQARDRCGCMPAAASPCRRPGSCRGRSRTLSRPSYYPCRCAGRGGCTWTGEEGSKPPWVLLPPLKLRLE